MDPVCLVITPSVFLLDERVFMSLGILRVAAVLESQGRAVKVVDLSGIENFTLVAEYYKGDPDGGYQAYIFTDAMTSPELVTARGLVEADVRGKLGIPFSAHAVATAVRF
jgi:hypothetical protein